MKKKMMFFVLYPLIFPKSGSGVIPIKMHEAFKEIGYDVFLISGNKEEKKKRLLELKQTKIKFDFCYSELSSYPLQLQIDYCIYSYLHKVNIPIGIFYRDPYWMFKDYTLKKV